MPYWKLGARIELKSKDRERFKKISQKRDKVEGRNAEFRREEQHAPPLIPNSRRVVQLCTREVFCISLYLQDFLFFFHSLYAYYD